MIDKHTDAPRTREEEQTIRSLYRIRDARRGSALDARNIGNDDNGTTCARVMARAREMEEHNG